jgi:hypothetical protein
MKHIFNSEAVIKCTYTNPISKPHYNQHTRFHTILLEQGNCDQFEVMTPATYLPNVNATHYILWVFTSWHGYFHVVSMGVCCYVIAIAGIPLHDLQLRRVTGDEDICIMWAWKGEGFRSKCMSQSKTHLLVYKMAFMGNDEFCITVMSCPA